MKRLSILLIPSIALLLSACAGPAGPGYGYGYGPGPDPRVGYYWNGTVYIQGDDPYRHDGRAGYGGYDRNVTDVNVDRTNINDTTVNRTNVNERNVNASNFNRSTAKHTSPGHSYAAASKGDTRQEKDHGKREKDQPGAQQ